MDGSAGEEGISWLENSTSGVFLERENDSGYSFGVALGPAPEAACQEMNKNAGCLQWRRKKGFLRL